MKCTALVLAFVSSATVMSAQAPSPGQSGPAFEVASVKQNVSAATGFSFFFPPGRVTITNLPLRTIIAHAYGMGSTLATPDLSRFRLAGGPDRLLSTRFDVTAKAPDGSTQAQNMLMLRALLAERFNLRVHAEMRQLPIYALAVVRDGQLGPQLRRSPIDCVAFMTMGGGKPTADAETSAACWAPQDPGQLASGVRTQIYAGPIAQLLTRIQAYADRPVFDATGLTGSFEWRLTFKMDPADDLPAPSIFTALPEQLGLKLESRTGPVEVLVIDSVEMPTAD